MEPCGKGVAVDSGNRRFTVFLLKAGDAVFQIGAVDFRNALPLLLIKKAFHDHGKRGGIALDLGLQVRDIERHGIAKGLSEGLEGFERGGGIG